MAVQQRSPPDALVPDTDEMTSLVWAARTGTRPGVSLVFDSSEYIVLAVDDSPLTNESDRRAHERATEDWAANRDSSLPEASSYLFLDGHPSYDWSYRVAEDTDGITSLIRYRVDYHESKWNQYAASVSARAMIPRRHGTLCKHVKYQGFASHIPDARNTVTTYASLTHKETGHTFFENDVNSYTVPNAREDSSFPFVPPLLNSLYNQLFMHTTMHEEIQELLTRCDRCGVFDKSHGDAGVDVEPVDGGNNAYCPDCHASVLRQEHGVLDEVARNYVALKRGESPSSIANRSENPDEWVKKMLGKMRVLLS